jgi:uncharacterized protein (TIGR02594 family)
VTVTLAASLVVASAAFSTAMAGPRDGVRHVSDFSASRRHGHHGGRSYRHDRHHPRRGHRYTVLSAAPTSPFGTSVAEQPRQPRRGQPPAPSQPFGFGRSDVVAEARRYLGFNPTGRGSLWCARFMNLVLERTGHHGSGSDMARSFASYGRRVSGPQVGAIAVMARRGGGHVGVVSGVDASGNPIVVSGNHGHRVAEAVYPRDRIYAYVLPM